MQALPMIVAMAIATYATRIAGFTLSGRDVPGQMAVFLKYVPVAAFAALVVSGLESGTGSIESRILGAIVAGVVILRWARLWAGLVTGMICYWMLGLIA